MPDKGTPYPVLAVSATCRGTPTSLIQDRRVKKEDKGKTTAKELVLQPSLSTVTSVGIVKEPSGSSCITQSNDTACS
jgi:hypothetical protein